MRQLSKHLISVVVTAALILPISTNAASTTTATTAPAAPSILTVRYAAGVMALAWADNSFDETGFSIERCSFVDLISCTEFGQIATVGAGTASYNDTYYSSRRSRYRVRAFNSAGYSAYSNVVENSLLTTGEWFPKISAAPTTGQAPLTVNFDGSGSRAINNTISAYRWSFGDNQTASGPVVSHTYTTPGVYAASLFIGDGTSVIITVTAPPLVAPSDLSTTSVKGNIRLTWTNPVSSATSLTLDRCTGIGCTSFTRIARLTTSTTSFTDSNIKGGTTYSYRLAASDSTATMYSNTAVANVRR